MIIANEVLDALAVERFAIRGSALNAVGVAEQMGRLEWSETRAQRRLDAAVRRIESDLGERLPDGYVSEFVQVSHRGCSRWQTG